MKMLGLLAEHSGGGFPAALLTLALFAATMGAAPCPAADPATLLAARTLLLDAQVFGQTVVAVGAGGHILRSTDSGHTWQLAQTPTLATHRTRNPQCW